LGTELMRVSTNPRVVQEQLGHADLRMLQRYAHVIPNDQRTAVERATEITRCKQTDGLASPTGFERVLPP